MSRYLFFVSELYALAILRPLQEAVRARGDEAAWFCERESLSEYLRPEEVRLASVQAVIDWRPDAVFVPGNWVPQFFPGLKVEVFHGFSVGKRSEARGHFRVRGSFDLYCTQGPDTTQPFQQLQQQLGFFRVVETGWSKLDPLFNGRYPRDQRTRPVVLYASTFTESITSARVLRDTIAASAQRGDWQWLVTLHPKMAPDIIESYRALEGPDLRFAMTDDILALYAQADVLLSDTSSVVPEFLTQHRPVVTLRNRRPGPHLLDVQEIAEVIPAVEHALQQPESLMNAIRDYANRIHPYRDGRSSERVLDATSHAIQVGRAGLTRKPLNVWRRVQARQRLGYWGF
ncbi:CDP-glycerol glycerophosphotransferase family protein [Povalibacter sp.]|uniref:CDP-glycerol glycerophosphotransferase family protein n=1 Tax=Povalibacter sp. TaxID=1962978 RepID=UPI002F3E494F